MSRVSLFTCNRCHVKQEGVGIPVYPPGWIKLRTKEPWNRMSTSSRFDLCDGCAGSFNEWFITPTEEAPHD